MSIWRTTFLGIGASVLIPVAGLTLASMHLDAFLVADGMGHHPGSIYRYRRCIGVTWEPYEVRHGADRRCIGVPLGPWRCYALVYDDPFIRIPCK